MIWKLVIAGVVGLIGLVAFANELGAYCEAINPNNDDVEEQ